MIIELKKQLHEEEHRSAGFKRELLDSEKREAELKKRLRELEAIQQNPQAETEKLIAEKEREIERLKQELATTDIKKQEDIRALELRLKEEQEKRQALEAELAKFKKTKNARKLIQSTSKTKQKDWVSRIFEQGQQQRKDEKWDEAVATFTQLLEKDPKHKDAYFYRALCLCELKRFEEAIADWNQVIELDPKDAPAYTNRGLAYAKLKDYQRAIADYNQALELDPEHIGTRLNLAEIYLITGKSVQSEQTARATIKLAQSTEDQAIGYYLLALSLKLQGKNTKKVDAELKRLCTEEFEITWSFDEIESWLAPNGSGLAKATIPNEVKTYIQEKTEMLKKHKR